MKFNQTLFAFLTPMMLMGSTQIASAQMATEDRQVRYYDSVYVGTYINPGPVSGGFFGPTLTEQRLKQLVVNQLQRANIPISTQGKSSDVVRLIIDLSYSRSRDGQTIYNCAVSWNINTNLRGENLILGLGGIWEYGYNSSDSNTSLVQATTRGCLDRADTFIDIWQATH